MGDKVAATWYPGKIPISIRYELHEQKSGRMIAWMQEVVGVEVGPNGAVSIPLPSPGATIDFNGTLGIVTERSGLDTEWTVRCVC